MAQVVECVPSKHEALNWNPSNTKKKKRKKEKEMSIQVVYRIQWSGENTSRLMSAWMMKLSIWISSPRERILRNTEGWWQHSEKYLPWATYRRGNQGRTTSIKGKIYVKGWLSWVRTETCTAGHLWQSQSQFQCSVRGRKSQTVVSWGVIRKWEREININYFLKNSDKAQCRERPALEDYL
jgi:hypothetical protein